MKERLLVGNLILLTIFSLSIVSALDNVNMSILRPSTSGVINGNYVINVTRNITTQAYDTAYLYIYSSSTVNSSSTIPIRSLANATDLSFNISYNTIGVKDSNDYTIKIIIMNGTGATGNITQSVTSITIDNFKPDVATSLDPADSSTITSSQTETFTATVTNATSCAYIIYRGTANSNDPINYISKSGTYSSNSCTFTKEFTGALNGKWYWIINSSDGTNYTANSPALYTVNIADNGAIITIPAGKKVDISPTPKNSNDNSKLSEVNNLIKNNKILLTIGIITFILILAFILTIIFLKIK